MSIKWLAGVIGTILSPEMSQEEESGEFDEETSDDPILELAINYALSRNYQPGLTKERKRAVRKRAATLVVDKGEVYLKRKGRQVKVVTSVDDQRRILESCHSEPTSGHFSTTKTWRRIAERFYWRGMSKQVKELVSRMVGLSYIILGNLPVVQWVDELTKKDQAILAQGEWLTDDIIDAA